MKNGKPADPTAHPVIGPMLKSIARQAAAWRSLQDTMAECFVASADTGAMVPDPFQVAAALTENTGLLESLPAEARKILAETTSWADASRRSAAADIEKRLVAFCATRQITFAGRFPSYFLAGFLPVEISAAQEECRVGGVRIRSLLFDTIAPRIAEMIAAETSRKFDPAAFLDEMHRAFQRAVLLQQAGPGDLVPIRAFLAELIVVKQPGSFFKNAAPNALLPYSAETFGRDLARLLKGGMSRTADGFQLQLGPASVSADGIVVRLEDTRIYGRIGFKKELL